MHRDVEVGADGDRAMVAEQDRVALAEAGDREVGELLGAERRVARAFDRPGRRIARSCSGRRGSADERRQRRAIGRVAVDDRADVGPRAHDVEMEAPFGRGLQRPRPGAVFAVERHRRHQLRPHQRRRGRRSG